MTRMTVRHRGAHPAAPDRPGHCPRRPPHLRRRRASRWSIMDWRLALVAMIVVPPLVIATDLVPAPIRARRTTTPATRSAVVNADFQESLTDVRVAQAFTREDQNTARFAGRSRDYLAPGSRPSSWSPSTSRSSSSCRASPAPSCSRAAPPWSRNGSLTSGDADRVPALPQPVLRADPAAVAGVRHLPAGTGRARPHRRDPGRAVVDPRGGRPGRTPASWPGRSSSTTCGSPTRRTGARCCTGSTSSSSRARRWRSWARPGPASRRSRSSSPATTT